MTDGVNNFTYQNKQLMTFIDPDGVSWFSLDDLFSILNIQSDHSVDEEDTRVFMIPNTPGGIRAVNESGLLTLTLQCNQKEFRRWVTNEVLPVHRKLYQIRKKT